MTSPFLKDKASLHQKITQNLEKARKTMEKFANRKRQEVVYEEGNLVMLRYTEDRPSPKLGLKFAGPFPVTKVINKVAYQLKLPTTWKCHNVFHVSLLKPFYSDNFDRPLPSKPGPILIEGNREWQVEEILDKKVSKSGKYIRYLIKWRGYGPEDNSWEPMANLQNANELIQKFEEKFAKVL